MILKLWQHPYTDMIIVIVCVKLVVRHYDDVPAAHTNVDIIVKEEGSEYTARETTDENGYIYREFTRPSHITVSIKLQSGVSDAHIAESIC